MPTVCLIWFSVTLILSLIPSLPPLFLYPSLPLYASAVAQAFSLMLRLKFPTTGKTKLITFGYRV